MTDARQAVYILDKLSSKSIMKKHLSDSEVNELAQVISTVKNKRFLDSRKHMIDEITTVSTYMADKGYTQSEGAEYFTTLCDYWLYGDLHQRLSGLQAGFSVQPGYAHTDPGEDYKMNSLLMAALLEMQYEKPINLYWQHSAGLSLGTNTCAPNMKMTISTPQKQTSAPCKAAITSAIIPTRGHISGQESWKT